ncbi:MAG: PQQ-dependent sugar dehydrogenase, partial [Nocardioides sp.]
MAPGRARAVGLACLTLAALTSTLTACSSGSERTPSGTTLTATPAPTGPSRTATSTPPATPPSTAASTPPGPPRVVATVATGLAAPWGLAFLPDGDAVVTERDTRRLLLVHGPQHRLREVATVGDPVGEGEAGESGLLGVAVSPDFRRDHLLYLYVTTPT